MAYLGNQPALSYTSFAKQDFTVTATTSYTLDNPVANANELALFINFVRQEPTTAYSASGTSLTLTEATSSSDDMYCVYLGKAVQTVTPPNNSVTNAMLVDDTITGAKLSKPFNYDSGTLYLDDTNNRVGILDTSPSFPLEVNGTIKAVGTNNLPALIVDANSTNEGDIAVADGQVLTFGHHTLDGNTGSFSPRMRIDTSGNTSMFQLNLNITSGSNTANAIRFERNSSIDNDGDVRFVVFGSGNVQNSNNSYAGISDVKLKENIVDATPKLEKLKQVQIRSYNFKDEPDFKQIGVIAQELETVFPNMVEDIPDTDKKGNELGTSTKSVKYSVFVPILIKALQEANSKIEELEARIQTLENN